MSTSDPDLNFFVFHKKNILVGPKLPQKCEYGSMVSLPNENEAVLVGCVDENHDITEKIYKLTWQGEHLKWVTMVQKLKYPRYGAVAMLVQNEITNCN